jgi:hypothetical protein
MARAANAIDFWRGFALVTIFINHIPGITFERLTYRRLSISDSAELFVFLAGWALRHAVGRPEDPTPASRLFFRLGGRAFTLYAAHLLIVMLAIAMLAASARLLDNPLLLEWHNAAAVFSDPADAHIGLVLLSHQLGYFDILPLYVVLLLIAPVLALVHRQAPDWLLPLSLVVYLFALVFQVTIPTWPTDGQWFFNPLCWQLIFVLGFTLSRERGLGGWVGANIAWLRLAAWPIAMACAVIAWNGWWPDATAVPEPKLLFINGKTFLTPMRVLQFLALAAAMSAAYPLVVRAVPRVVEFLALLGRNSLHVFCAASLLSLACQIVRFSLEGGVVVDAGLVAAGIAVLGTVAWMAEWRHRDK